MRGDLAAYACFIAGMCFFCLLLPAFVRGW